MAGWHHQFNGCELRQTLGDGEGHEGLACFSPRGHDFVTEQQILRIQRKPLKV